MTDEIFQRPSDPPFSAVMMEEGGREVTASHPSLFWYDGHSICHGEGAVEDIANQQRPTVGLGLREDEQ